MTKVNNTDLLLLGFIILISLVFFIFYPKINNDIETEQKIEDNKSLNKFIKSGLNEQNKHNDNFNNDPLSSVFNPINTYNEEIYYSTDGFQNELIPKYKQFVTDNIEKYFIGAKKDVPLDYSHTCSKSGDCPPSKEQKYDIPMRNVPMCYLKDNKSTQLSKEIKNENQYGITEFEINQDEFNIIRTLDKNTKELPLANVNVNYLEKTKSPFISHRIQNI